MLRTSDLPTDSVDAQVTIVGATIPKELVDTLQDMLPVRTVIHFFSIRSTNNTYDALTFSCKWYIPTGAFFFLRCACVTFIPLMIAEGC